MSHALLLCRTFPPMVGGLERYTSELFRRSGISLRVLAPSYVGDEVFDAALPFPVHRYRFRSNWHGTKKPLIPLSVAAIREVLASAPALLISDQVQSAGVALPLSRIIRRPHVVFAYGRELNPQSLGSVKGHVFRRSAAVIAISSYTRNRLIRTHRVDPQRVWLIPPGVDSDVFQPPASREAKRVEAGFADEDLVLLSIGRMEQASRFKGFDRVIQLVSRLRGRFPGLRAVMIGDGDDLSFLKGVAAKLGVADRIAFEGRVSDARIRLLYQAADVFVLPSGEAQQDTFSAEGYGIVYAEAAASGLPCVGFALGGVSDVVMHGESGILTPPSQDALCDVVALLLEDGDLRRQLGSKARQIAVDRLSWNSSTQTLRRLTQDVSPNSVIT